MLERGFSTVGFFTDAPLSETRYRLRVRCSSQPAGSGCEDATTARVLIYPADLVDEVALGDSQVLCDVEATGDPVICDPGDPLEVSFAKPQQSGGFDGFGLYRIDDVGLASPVIDGECVVPSFGAGAPTGSTVTAAEPAPFVPVSGGVAHYVVAHRPAGAATEWPAGLARLPGNETETGRFLAPPCP
jgi:hypothetical protein